MSHYSIGYNEYIHKGKVIKSIVGNAAADEYLTNFTNGDQTKLGVVPPPYKDRPDLISNLFLGDSNNLWYICLSSRKFDVFEDFNTGSNIRTPK